MSGGGTETGVSVDASRFIDTRQHRRKECFCYRATLDDLLADELMAPVLHRAGYKPDEFREMITEMAGRNSKRFLATE
jgi:hypothetical protein